MIRQARLPAVAATVLSGAIGVIGSTQTWLTAVLADGQTDPLLVPGASALPMLVPLSLAVLALGAALPIVGLVLRYVFGALSFAIAAVLGILTAQIAFAPPTSAVASAVTEATGIAGAEAVAELVSSISSTPWPLTTLAAEVLLAAAAVFTLATARRWRGAGRRYRTTAQPVAATAGGSRPHDAVDSWDDLSRGDDPTA